MTEFHQQLKEWNEACEKSAALKRLAIEETKRYKSLSEKIFNKFYAHLPPYSREELMRPPGWEKL